MKKKILTITYFFICIIISASTVSYGYLDPSAMTYIIQISSAVIITGSTIIGICFYKIRKILKSMKKKDKIVKMDLNNITEAKIIEDSLKK